MQSDAKNAHLKENQHALKHGADGALKRQKEGKPFIGLARTEEDAVAAELETSGIAELVPVRYNGTDTRGMMEFQATSVNGTSVFGLVTLKATKMAQENNPYLAILPMQQPAIMTIAGMFTWFLASVQQNPAGAIAVIASAGAAYAGRKRGMW